MLVSAMDSNQEYVKHEWPCFRDFIEELADDLTGDVRLVGWLYWDLTPL